MEKIHTKGFFENPGTVWIFWNCFLLFFGEKLFDFLDTSHADVLNDLKRSGELSDELNDKIKGIIENFVKSF